jgi:hypothetical protein
MMELKRQCAGTSITAAPQRKRRENDEMIDFCHRVVIILAAIFCVGRLAVVLLVLLHCDPKVSFFQKIRERHSLMDRTSTCN